MPLNVMHRNTPTAKELARDRRLARWRHNGFFGSCRMFHVSLIAMLGSETTTDDTKILARKLMGDVELLNESLKKRKAGT